MDWRESNGLRWLTSDLGPARAVFSTRQGGVSSGQYAALNLGFTTDDEPQAVRENRARLALALALDPADVVAGFQVHGSTVCRHDARLDGAPYLNPPRERLEADGHTTAIPGLAPMVVVADCLPVALSGPGGVAMLHCGWRGLAAGIIGRGVEATKAEAAAIGPGIGQCCYEVGPDVLEAIDPGSAAVVDGGMLDLAEVAAQQLLSAGVTAIERAELCTHCNPELFFSHRRDGGVTGRQAGLVFSWPN